MGRAVTRAENGLPMNIVRHSLRFERGPWSVEAFIIPVYFTSSQTHRGFAARQKQPHDRGVGGRRGGG